MANTKTPYRILGVDPGTNVLGYAIIEVTGSRLRLVEMGVVSMLHLGSQQQKLRKILERLRQLINMYHPREMAIEAPFFGKNVQSMLKLGRAQGVAIAAAMTEGLETAEYAPKEIKKAVTGNGNATKEQVAAMLERMLAEKVDEKMLDATDALAAAVCHYHRKSSPLSGNGKKYKDWKSFLKDRGLS